MVTIRAALETDHVAILNIWYQGWHDAHAALVPTDILQFRTPDYFRLWLEQCTDSFYVATDGDTVCGFTSIKNQEVVKLYVHPDSRGGGVAIALLTFAEDMLAKTGAVTAELLCTAGNSRAQRFYERNGWTLYRTFADALWVPEGVSRRIMIGTHHYRKILMPR